MNLLQTIFTPGQRVFSVIVLIFLGLFALLNGLLFTPEWLGWLPYDIAGKISAMGHLTSTDDAVHEFIFSLIMGTAAVGMLAQLYKPSQNIAGQLVALIVWISWLLGSLLTNNWVPFLLILIFGGLTLLAAIFHPAGKRLFNWLDSARVNRALLALVIIAAVPLLFLAITNINSQRTEMTIHLQNSDGESISIFGHKIPAHGDDEIEQEPLLNNEAPEHDHAAIGHFKNMAVFSFIVILVGLLVSFRPLGWRFMAWVAGALLLLFGLVSLIFANNSASLGLFWSIAAVLWGIIFITAAETGINIVSSGVG